MSADRARLSYARTRKYREVVSQQGRVTLEADVNEAQRLASEELRGHALDFVGPWGTPDNGYECKIVGGQLTVGPGTMFAGGQRVTTEAGFNYADQPDWRDAGLQQPWTQEIHRDPAGSFEHAMLVLREQEITAVEDPALRDVALGGPDTAARTRLLQRVMLFATDTPSCDAATKTTAAQFAAMGLRHNPATAALEPEARLKVGLVTGDAPATACDPPAASGYLGADNQLIRLQVVEYNRATRRGKLIWGYNNASTLFRCKAIEPALVELEQSPVSDEFRPRAGQVVQMLLPAADLGEDAKAAALTGHVARLATGYLAETHRVQLPAPLPAPMDTAPFLFLRLWEDQLDFQLRTAVELPGTGLEVMLSSASDALHLGDYWSIAVRPQTPDAVYPQRYLTDAQPPDGPRMWAAPLAVVGQNVNVDCRLPFDNLPELTARQSGGGDCCRITVKPEDAERLQEIIDDAIGAAGLDVTICFEPGEYKLPRPLYFTEKHDGLTLEACSGNRPVLRAGDPGNDEFIHGLVILTAVKDVSIEGLEFLTVPVPIPGELQDLMGRAHNSANMPGEWLPKTQSTGIRILHCVSVTITDCKFALMLSEQVLAMGVLSQGRTGKVAVRKCRFGGLERFDGSDWVSIGVLFAPLLQNVDSLIEMSEAEAFEVESSEFSFLQSGIHLSGNVILASIRNNSTRSMYNSLALLAYRDLRLGHHIWENLGRIAAEAAKTHIFSVPAFYDALRNSGLSQVVNAGLLVGAGKLTDGVRPRGISYSFGDMPVGDLRNEDAPWADFQRIVVEGNRFASYPTNREQSFEGPDTLIWDVVPTDFKMSGWSDLTVTGNVMMSLSRCATLGVLMSRAFNITGNVVTNRAKLEELGTDPMSLVALPNMRPRDGEAFTRMFTVTGNTFHALTNLEELPRQEWQIEKIPRPLQTWNFFNTIHKEM